MFQIGQLLSWKGACGHKDARNKGDMASLSHATQIKVRGTNRSRNGNAVFTALQITRKRNTQPQFRASNPDIFIWRLKKQVLAIFKVNFVLPGNWG